MKKDNIVNTLRNLVSSIYNDCFGAYGSDERYQGQYEDKIQAVADAIVSDDKEYTKPIGG